MFIQVVVKKTPSKKKLKTKKKEKFKKNQKNFIIVLKNDIKLTII